MPYHTHLGVILTPLKEDIKNFQWLIADVEYQWAEDDFPLNMEDEYLIVSPDTFQRVLNQNTQIIWGSFLGMPKSKKLKIDTEDIPYVESNPLVWEPGNIQHPEALIEIDCIDSGYTIVKFVLKDLSDKFKAFFGDEAIELSKFK